MKCGKMGNPPQVFPKDDSNSTSSNGNGGGIASKRRYLHYTQSDDDDDGDEMVTMMANWLNVELHLILATSCPWASPSSSISFSHKVHAKGSHKKGKKMYYYDRGDDILWENVLPLKHLCWIHV